MTHKEISHEDDRVEEINGIDQAMKVLERRIVDIRHDLIGDRVAKKVEELNNRIREGDSPWFALVGENFFPENVCYTDPMSILRNAVGKRAKGFGFFAQAPHFKGGEFLKHFKGDSECVPQVCIPGDYSDIDVTSFCLVDAPEIEQGARIFSAHRNPQTSHTWMTEPQFALATKLMIGREAVEMGIMDSNQMTLYVGRGEVEDYLTTHLNQWRDIILEKGLKIKP